MQILACSPTKIKEFCPNYLPSVAVAREYCVVISHTQTSAILRRWFPRRFAELRVHITCVRNATRVFVYHPKIQNQYCFEGVGKLRSLKMPNFGKTLDWNTLWLNHWMVDS